MRGRDTSINETQLVKNNIIQIPVEVNRLIKVTDKLHIIAGAGMVFGWHVKTTANKLLNPENNQLYPYALLKDKVRTFNVSPSMTFGVQNTLSKHMVLQTALFGNMSMYSRFKDAFGVKDIPYSMGINIKLLYIIK